MKLKTTLAAAASGLALFLAGPALAQEHDHAHTHAHEHAGHHDAASDKATATQSKTAMPALWKVADEDTTIWLFGTVHALPDGIEWYAGPVKTALAGSEELVTEIILDESTTAEMQKLVMEKGMLPADQTLRGLLDEGQTERYEATMTKLGLPVAAFDRFEPWYASMMFAMLPLMQQGYSPEAGVEFSLARHAGEGKKRGELETIEYQLSMFDDLPQAKQLDYMMQTIDQVDEIKPMIDKMVGEWMEGDADGLADLMNESMDDALIAETLLYTRNRAWAEWIDERLDTPGEIFVAVGAGHLAGAQSVQDALTDRGIETTRIQ